jgi:hypothetical protein
LRITVTASPYAYNSPPNWPPPPPGWTPPAGWTPDPAWGPPPDGWEFWVLGPVAEPINPLLDVPFVPPASVRPVRVNWFVRHKVLTGIGAVFIALTLYGAATDGNGNGPTADNRPNTGSAARPLAAVPSSTSSTPSSSSTTKAAAKPSATKKPSPSATRTKSKPTSKPSPKPSPKPARTTAPQPAHHVCTKTSGGNCIQGGEFCPQASYGMSGWDGSGRRYVCKGDHTHPHWMTP